MAVRGRSDGLLQTVLLQARPGVRRAFGRGHLGFQQGAGTDRALSVAFRAWVFWNSGSNCEPQPRSLLLIHRSACQAQSKVTEDGDGGEVN